MHLHFRFFFVFLRLHLPSLCICTQILLHRVVKDFCKWTRYATATQMYLWNIFFYGDFASHCKQGANVLLTQTYAFILLLPHCRRASLLLLRCISSCVCAAQHDTTQSACCCACISSCVCAAQHDTTDSACCCACVCVARTNWLCLENGLLLPTKCAQTDENLQACRETLPFHSEVKLFY